MTVFAESAKLGKQTALFVIVVALAFLAPTVSAGFNWSFNGQNYTQHVVQLWYEGYWTQNTYLPIQSLPTSTNSTKSYRLALLFRIRAFRPCVASNIVPVAFQVGWVNGTLMKLDWTKNMNGKIVWLDATTDAVSLENYLRKLARYNPKALLVAAVNVTPTAVPGILMYLACDGKERRSINYPVGEAGYILFQNWTRLPDGTYLEILFEINLWKYVSDTTHWQVIVGSLLSLWTWLIFVGCVYRIWQFYTFQDTQLFSIFSIGPLCLLFEAFGALLRFSHTVVDPFWSNRVYPSRYQYAILTLHIPFVFASGVLLTFYWVESLTSANVTATPYITKYRIVAIITIALMFGIEIANTIARVLTFGTAGPAGEAFGLISVILYSLGTVALIIAFLFCAIAIWRRLSSLGATNRKYFTNLTLRFGASIIGYLSLVAFIIGVNFTGGRLVISQLIFFLIYISLNWVGTCQVLALKPVKIKTKSHASGTHTGSKAVHSDGSHSLV